MKRQRKGGWSTRLREWAGSATGAIYKILICIAVMAGLALVLFDLGHYLVGSRDFGVREQLVDGEDMATAEEIRQLAGIETGANIWLVRTHDVAQKVVKHPWIRACMVEKVAPSQIWIRVEERVPLMACVHPETGETFGVDAEGFILPSFQVLFGDRESRRAEKARRYLARLPLITGHDADVLVTGKRVAPNRPIPSEETEPVEDEPESLGNGMIYAPRLATTIDAFAHFTHNVPNFAKEIDTIDLSAPGELRLCFRDGSGPIRVAENRVAECDRRLADTWRMLKQRSMNPEYIDARFPEIGLALQFDHITDQQWLSLCQQIRRTPS